MGNPQRKLQQQKKKKSIKTQLLLSTILLIAVICIVFALITVVSVNNLLKGYVSTEMSNRAEDASKLVEQQINTYIAQVEDIASREDMRTMDWSIQQDVLILKILIMNKPQHLMMFFLKNI